MRANYLSSIKLEILPPFFTGVPGPGGFENGHTAQFFDLSKIRIYDREIGKFWNAFKIWRAIFSLLHSFLSWGGEAEGSSIQKGLNHFSCNLNQMLKKICERLFYIKHLKFNLPIYSCTCIFFNKYRILYWWKHSWLTEIKIAFNLPNYTLHCIISSYCLLSILWSYFSTSLGVTVYLMCCCMYKEKYIQKLSRRQ